MLLYFGLRFDYNILIDIAISIFTGWLLYFLVEYIPQKIKEKKAIKFILPKIEKIYEKIYCALSLLCYMVDADINDQNDVEIKLIHLITCNKNTRVNIIRYLNGVEYQRFNEPFNADSFMRLHKSIAQLCLELEKFMVYLPFNLCGLFSKIESNISFLVNICQPFSFRGITYEGIRENFSNHVIIKQYNELKKSLKLMAMMDINIVTIKIDK